MNNYLKLNKLIVSFFGIGFLNGGGTLVSILTFFICDFFLQKLSLLKIICLFIVFLIFSVILINFELKKNSKKDPSYVVLDEICGYLLGFILLKYFSIESLNVLFLILFRYFDIYKPFFIKKIEFLSGYNGVILDDFLAAFYAFLFLFVFRVIFFKFLFFI